MKKEVLNKIRKSIIFGGGVIASLYGLSRIGLAAKYTTSQLEDPLLTPTQKTQRQAHNALHELYKISQRRYKLLVETDGSDNSIREASRHTANYEYELSREHVAGHD